MKCVAVVLLLSAAACSGAPCVECKPGPGDSPEFDLAARQADILANGGVYVIIADVGEDVYLEIVDPGSEIFGAAVSIPSETISAVGRGLLSIEPYDGPALSLTLGQDDVGPAIVVALVDDEDGNPKPLPNASARVFAPYHPDGFPVGYTESAVFLGIQFSQFAAGLTALTGRSLDVNPDRVSGLAAKFGTFVAYHDAAAAGPLPDDEDEDGIPDDPSSQTARFEVESCSVQMSGVNTKLIRSLSYTLDPTVPSKSKFEVAARQGSSELLRYITYVTGGSLPLPISPIDPGFPDGLAGYAFTLGCNGGGGLKTANNAADPMTDESNLPTLGVTSRSLSVKSWFTTSVQQSTCGVAQTCDIHTGYVQVDFASLTMTDPTDPLSTPTGFDMDTWFPGAIWEVPK